MRPTEDSFHALARSAPWRWRRLHFVHRSSNEQVEAWLERPDGVRVARTDGTPVELEPGVDAQHPTRTWSPPEATYRPDGLVARRSNQVWDLPGGGRVSVDMEQDGMSDGVYWDNYHWVAMVDPFELSHHVSVLDPREDEVNGRLAWRATLVPQPGYEPRCGGNCCELLYSHAGLMADFSEDHPPPHDWLGETYPEAYDVALDVATAVVVRCLPIGDGGDHVRFENDILSAD